MIINKLDLLSKGWSTSEIEKASQILAEAENDKGKKIKIIDGLLIVVLGILMLVNGYVCSQILVPFIYGIQTNFILVLAAIIGFVFGALLTVVIYDVEKIHHRHETNLFIAFIVSGIVNFYFILEFTAQFGAKTHLPVLHNMYTLAGTYLIAFLAPHLVYQLTKKSEI
jgi:predicted neutral ceramidase superfamily lipid hydrolase